MIMGEIAAKLLPTTIALVIVLGIELLSLVIKERLVFGRIPA